MLNARWSCLALPLLVGVTLAAAPTARRSWELGRFTWIKRVPAEAGARPSLHPAAVDPAALQRALSSLQVTVDKEDEPLFTAQESAGLARALAEALALAAPSEDLELVATTNRSSFILASSLTVTARAFMEGGDLHLIFHDVRGDLTYGYHLDGRTPPFTLGARARASAVAVKPGSGSASRPDWVRFTLASLAPQVPVPAPPAPAPARPTAAPPAPAPGVPKAAPAPIPAAPSTLEERLLRLKRLRDQNLITEEEYARRKAELLKEL